MSFSFWVRADNTPSFGNVIEAAGVRCELKDAGPAVDGWPKGLLQKVPDATNIASSLALTPQLAEIFTKMGLGAGTFIAHLPGKSTRGVEVSFLKQGTAQFRVCALASVDDYALAAKLAASLAKLTNGTVEAEHGPDGREIAALAPDTFLSTFNEQFFEKNARDMGDGLLSQVAGGASYFFYGPKGWIPLRPEHFVGVDVGARLTRARELLRAAQQPLPSTGSAVDGKRVAALLARAMTFAAAADGKLDPEEARVLERHFLTVNALRGYDPNEILREAQRDGAKLVELRELPTVFRYTAFVLAAEILGSTRGGKIYGDLSDPNVKAAGQLATALGLATDEQFIIRAGVTVNAKYIDGGGDVTDEMARTMTLAMLLAAAADGKISDQETAVMAALAQTVPELRARDFAKLVEEAKARVPHAEADFQAMPKFKNKTYALACEVSMCSQAGGARVSVPIVLDQLQRALGVPAEFADGAIRVWGAKYAVVGR